MRPGRSGFSLIELVIVVVIIAIIGAIAIPKMSRGASGAADSSLVQNLSVLRQALDLYQSEHGGNFPAIARMPAALLQYSADDGTTSATRTNACQYGPYLRTVPPLPVGALKGASGIDLAANAATTTVGWLYEPATGTITANTAAGEVDAKNVAYNAY